jgi:hypothetical protein
MAEIKVRYSDQDLEEFRQVIDKKACCGAAGV